MRIPSLLISAALCLSSQAQAVELFHENFEVQPTSTFALNTSDLGGTAGTGGDNQWIINNAYTGGSGTLVCMGFPFSFTVPNTPTQPAAIPGNPTSYYLHTTATAAVANGISNATYIPADGTCVLPATHFASMTGDVSTSGMDNVTLDFWWLLGGSNTSYGEVYYSLDSGASWTQITDPVASYFNQPAWIQTTLSMPEWDNQPTLRFGFRFVNNVSTTASDPGFGIDEIRIAAEPANDLPIAEDDAFEVDEDMTLNGDVRINDTASGDGGNAWSLVDDVVHGSLSFVDGQFTYTPNANYNGPDSFSYQLCDVDVDCDSATVTLTVNPVNDLPVAFDDAYQVGPEGSLDVYVSVNDVTSGDGGNVWALVAPPSGALDLAANGNLLYAADAGFAGDVIFDYSLCDVDDDCDDATVTITVKPVVIFSDDFE